MRATISLSPRISRVISQQSPRANPDDLRTMARYYPNVLEYPGPNAPYGLRGVGELPTISSGPAVAAGIRAATGLDLAQIPIRPEHITDGR